MVLTHTGMTVQQSGNMWSQICAKPLTSSATLTGSDEWTLSFVVITLFCKNFKALVSNLESSTCVQSKTSLEHLISVVSIFYWCILSFLAQSCNQEVKAAKPEAARHSLCLDHHPKNSSVSMEIWPLASRMSVSWTSNRTLACWFGSEIKKCLLLD